MQNKGNAEHQEIRRSSRGNASAISRFTAKLYNPNLTSENVTNVTEPADIRKFLRHVECVPTIWCQIINLVVFGQFVDSLVAR